MSFEHYVRLLLFLLHLNECFIDMSFTERCVLYYLTQYVV